MARFSPGIGKVGALRMFRSCFDRMHEVIRMADDRDRAADRQLAFSKALCLFRRKRNASCVRVLRWRDDASDPHSSGSLLASIPAF
jgi:hypothetical protein